MAFMMHQSKTRENFLCSRVFLSFWLMRWLSCFKNQLRHFWVFPCPCFSTGFVFVITNLRITFPLVHSPTQGSFKLPINMDFNVEFLLLKKAKISTGILKEIKSTPLHMDSLQTEVSWWNISVRLTIPELSVGSGTTQSTSALPSCGWATTSTSCGHSIWGCSVSSKQKLEA